jgi:ribosomal protein L18E
MHELVTAPEIVGDDKLRRELKSLIEQFRRWAPPDDRKAWKELRWRLEALATVPTSKL